ncbi:MAG TPA: hypothetical protein VII10_05760, partial [Reyranella sp.]
MTDKRPDLARLSAEQKDALIRDLWRQVAAVQSEARLLKRRLGMAEPPGERSESVLLEKLRDAAPRPSVEPPPGIAVKLGRGLRLWRSPVVLGVVGIILAAFAIDGGIGIYQARALREQRQARLLLEHEALTA